MEINATTVLVAALGAGGAGAVLREIVAGLSRLARGVSLRESGRKHDLVRERDEAVARANAADRNRWRIENYVAALQRQLILAGTPFPPAPILEDTISPEQVAEIRAELEAPEA